VLTILAKCFTYKNESFILTDVKAKMAEESLTSGDDGQYGPSMGTSARSDGR